MSKKTFTRREFLTKGAAGAAAVALSTASAPAFSRMSGANDRLSIGVIGAGTRGGQLMRELHDREELLNAEFTAICDTWRLAREGTIAECEKWYGHKPREFVDYRDLIALDDIDGVIIATPDFSHGKIMLDALEAGKDVYIEKPMVMTMEENNAVFDMAKKKNAVVQVGTQRRSDGKWMGLEKQIQAGALGKITRVEIGWNDRNPRWRRSADKVKKEDVAWDLYLMDLPYREFTPELYRQWHLHRDFTMGAVGVLGSHYLDVTAWMMNDPYPKHAVGLGGQFLWHEGREHEDTVFMLFEYPKEFICKYASVFGNKADEDAKFYGTKGMFREVGWQMRGDGGRKNIRIEGVINPEREKSTSHVQNWIECMRSRKQTNAPIEAGHQHTVACIMGYQAMMTGIRKQYLPASRKIVDG